MCAHMSVHVQHAPQDSWILLANVKFGNRLFNRQIAKLKPTSTFPIIRYLYYPGNTYMYILLEVNHNQTEKSANQH